MLDLNVLHKEFAKRGAIPLATLNIGLSAVACVVMIWGESLEAAMSIVGILALLNGGTSVMNKKMQKQLIEQTKRLEATE